MSELAIAAAFGLVVGGYFAGGRALIVAGIGIGALAGLELSCREHVAGYRSHSTLLAATVALTSGTALFGLLHVAGVRSVAVPIIAIGVAAAAFAFAFRALRQRFRERSGGASFR